MKINRILIVDDNKDVRLKLRSILDARYNLEVVGEASDGLESIDAADSLHPNLILMDIVMPKMNGLDASRNISQKHPEIKIILLTYYYDEEYKMAAEKNGASGYIVKDATTTELIRTIQVALKGDWVFNENKIPIVKNKEI